MSWKQESSGAGIGQKEFEVVLVGSIYEMGEMIISPMREVIISEAPKAQLVRLSSPPVVGGVLLAMEQVEIDPYPLRDHLIKSTLVYLRRYRRL